MRGNCLRFVAVTLALIAGLAASPLGFGATDLPERLTDQEFWRLTEDLSEPSGAFMSDNLLSNERVFARLVPDLVERTRPGGVYLGVGPEQNFTYIAAMRPRMAFITDIRRGNLHLLLMYKALFELSADRAEFVSRLFTKPRPAGLTGASTSTELMSAYRDAISGDEAAYANNLQAIQNHLTKTHAFRLSAEDRSGIAAIYRAFYRYGPSITWGAKISMAPNPTTGTIVGAEDIPPPPNAATYWDLVTQTGANGQALSYLASEEKFNFLKELERKNLIVPVVGDFSGPKALRAVGAYVRSRGATVTAFYVSNVEIYLQRANTWTDFCANVATMPLDEGSFFIRPSGSFNQQSVQIRMDGTLVGGVTVPAPPPYATPAGLAFGVVPMAAELKACGK